VWCCKASGTTGRRQPSPVPAISSFVAGSLFLAHAARNTRLCTAPVAAVRGVRMKAIHIIAGLLALITGAVALYAAKGSKVHRKSGRVFAIAMLVMSSTGAVMAIFMKPNRVNVMAGVLTFYLVSTGLLTMLRSVDQSRRLLACLMAVALTGGAFAFAMALQAVNSPNGTVDGIPAPPLFMFGFVGILAGLLDVRVLVARKIEGAHRIARHLWRMTFSMWIATMSFFIGQPKVFPEPLRHMIGVRAIPVVIVLLLMFYWLGRTYIKRDRPAVFRNMPEVSR
jgi:uncharacterized membrane protein